MSITSDDQETVDGSPAQVGIAHNHVTYASIKFQLGPEREVGVNGVTIEQVLDILINRLEGFQRGPFNCMENTRALLHLYDALDVLKRRTMLRKRQGVEGMNRPHDSGEKDAESLRQV